MIRIRAFLDLYRDILRRKLAGLSDQQIRQRHVPSQTTLGGLVKHLSAVEREWFQVVLAGRAQDAPPASTADGQLGSGQRGLAEGSVGELGHALAEAGLGAEA
jgi:hypothetical protein